MTEQDDNFFEGYTSVDDKLPISGFLDEKFEGVWYEQEVEVIADGVKQRAEFWACWEDNDLYPEADGEFLMEFDVDNVTHWKVI